MVVTSLIPHFFSCLLRTLIVVNSPFSPPLSSPVLSFEVSLLVSLSFSWSFLLNYLWIPCFLPKRHGVSPVLSILEISPTNLNRQFLINHWNTSQQNKQLLLPVTPYGLTVPNLLFTLHQFISFALSVTSILELLYKTYLLFSFFLFNLSFPSLIYFPSKNLFTLFALVQISNYPSFIEVTTYSSTFYVLSFHSDSTRSRASSNFYYVLPLVNSLVLDIPSSTLVL